MDPSQYRAEIRSAYVGELAGAETAAALLARENFTPEQRVKIEAIGQLELHVAKSLEPLVRWYNLEVGDLGEIMVKARTRAAATADWTAFLREFGDRLQPFTDRFDRLKANAQPQDLSALALLAEHEHALAAFGQDERAGRTDQSLPHLLRLLPPGV